MAKSKNNTFGAAPKIPLGPVTRTSGAGTLSIPRDSTSKAVGISSSSKVASINFGAFRSKSSTVQQSSPWANLLKQAASGGIASALGGDLSAITGLGGLFSGILGLFGGGKSAPPAPVQFVLPVSRQSTVTLHPEPSLSTATSSTAKLGNNMTVAYQPSSPALASGGNSGNNTLTVAYQPSTALASHTQVVQVVRQALLNSSSLNDVIADI